MQKKQIILTHENADFDAIASLLGAHKVYPAAVPVLPRRVNQNVKAYLSLYGNALPFTHAQQLPHGSYIERVILVDTHKLTYTRGMGKHIREVLVIDHHRKPEKLPEIYQYRGELLGATTTLLVEVIATRLIPVAPAEATLMLAGIYEDTGNLTYTSTTPRDLRAAAWLIDQGADLQIAVELLDHPLTPGQREIYDGLIANSVSQTIDGHPIIISWAESPVETEEEISTLAHKLKDLYEPNALIILVALDGNVQLVARSTTDDIDVSRLARSYGGGGHTRASAALIKDADVRETFEQVTANIATIVKPRIKVRDLMSRGVRTVKGDTYINELSQMMLRTGHEGFPVVNVAGDIIGLVTRNAVDRALQHGWNTQPVRRIMQSGSYSVAPDDAIEGVRTLMLQSGWGQIPVIENGHINGVITRTDMIRLKESAQDDGRRETAHLMAQAFPSSLLALLKKVGDIAAESGFVVYFVGGIVRDLLLNHQITDVDLVVEGNAIELGQALVKYMGGESRRHERFGTFKWMLPDDIWEKALTFNISNGNNHHPYGFALPEFIDLVTARTEFYERPTALPQIEPSSIKQDLHRRDFTINTLAVRLDPQRWGELLDFYGGRTDLENKTIRVLHSLSFIDDPTRILRAARFEARLDFTLETRTASLIHEALPMLKSITGSRIRHEFDLIFQEAVPEAVLQRLQNLNVLETIHQDMVCDDWLVKRFVNLREDFAYELWGLSAAEDAVALHWMLLLQRMEPAAQHILAERLALPRRIAHGLGVNRGIFDYLDNVAPKQSEGNIALKLAEFGLAAAALAWLVCEDTIKRDWLLNYAQVWQYIAPVLTGDDLKALGIAPGPVYRDILSALKARIIDDAPMSREQEAQFVQSRYSNHIA